MTKFSRKQVLAGGAALVAAAPLAKAVWPDAAQAEESATHLGHNHPALGHAAMVHDHVPAPGGPNELDNLTKPPASPPQQPGRPSDPEVVATGRRIEVAQGVFFEAWTYNGSVPGPVIRATEDDLLRVNFVNHGSHPHKIHFQGVT